MREKLYYGLMMSRFQNMMIALIPGYAETIKDVANNEGNLAWYGVGSGLQISR